MYLSRSELAAFDLLSDAAKCQVILTWVRALVVTNRFILREFHAPNLFDSGVRYKFQGATDDWQDIARCLATREASCNSLSAWRCAELQEAGEDATPYIQSQTVMKPDGSRLDVFHVIVHRGEGAPIEWEDPSRTLGMPASDPNMAGAQPVSTGRGLTSAMVGDAGAFPGMGVGEDVDSPSWGD
jgi:hypothetical protein